MGISADVVVVSVAEFDGTMLTTMSSLLLLWQSFPSDSLSLANSVCVTPVPTNRCIATSSFLLVEPPPLLPLLLLDSSLVALGTAAALLVVEFKALTLEQQQKWGGCFNVTNPSSRQ